MNVRQGMLIRELLGTTEFRTSEQYAEDMGCSDRTVRSDIAAIDSFLANAGFEARVISKPGSGIKLAPSPAERGRLQRLLDENEVSMRPKLERLSQELIILTCSPGPHTIESLARKLYVGKRLVQADLKKWQSALAPHSIELDIGKRIEVVGRERDVRMFVLQFLASFPPRAIEHRVESLLTRNNMSDEFFYEQMIDGVQKAMGVRFSSNGRRHMIIHAKIVVARLSLGCGLGEYQGRRPLIPYIAGLQTRFRRRFGLEVSVSELSFAQDLYDCCTQQWSPDLFEHELEGPVAEATEAVERALEQAFGLPVPSACHQPLGATIERALVRRSCDIASPNPNERMVKYDYMDGFCLLTSALGGVEELVDVGMYGSDYARVALVLMEYAQKVGHVQRYQAGLVVNCGIDLVQFGKRCIEQRLPAVRIVETLTEDEVRAVSNQSEVLADRFDLLISFEPLDVPFPNVVISSLVDERDLSAIAAALPLRGVGDIAWNEYDVPEERLGNVRDGGLVRTLVLERLAGEGVADMASARLVRLFDTVSWMQCRTLVVPLCDQAIRQTGAHLFHLKGMAAVFGKRCEKVAVLCVRLEDREDLMPLVERFKNMLAERAFSAPEEEDALYVEREWGN